MKNLKKTLAVVLAFAMILGMGTISSFAYTDVAEGTVVSEAVGILSGLNILTGFEDGTFRPSETVTRAQMAAIICRVLGYEDQAQSSKGSTIFNDVAADHWASGYINVAQAQQIINGYGDGNYGPEDKVTYEQAVKMIVSALGYDLPAQSKGGYPTGYLAVASANGITKNANGRVGDAAARSAIAVLVYNSLEVPLMIQDSWSTGTAGNGYSPDPDKTILSEYLNVKVVEGTVTATPSTALAVSGYKEDATAMATIGAEGSRNATLVPEIDELLGKKVVAYIGTENDVETGEIMIYAVAEKQGENKSLVLNANQLVKDNTEENIIKYTKEGSNTKYDESLAIKAIYKNFSTVYNKEEVKKLTTKEIYEMVKNGGTLEFIDADRTKPGYETLIVTEYNAEAVVKEVSVGKKAISFTLHTGSLAKIETDADDKLTIVYKDGALVDASAIAVGDTVSTVQVKGNDVRILYVSSKSVTGSVDSWSEDAVEIAGEEYALSAKALFKIEPTKEEAEAGYKAIEKMEGTFFLNVDGQIAYVDGSAAKGEYVFVLEVFDEGRDTFTATLVKTDGTVATYEFADTLYYDGTSAKKDASDVVDAIVDLMNAEGATYKATEGAYAQYDTAATLVFELKVKNGEISSLQPVKNISSATKKYYAEDMSFGASNFTEETVIFALKEAAGTEEKIKEEDIKVGKASALLADETEYTLAAFGDLGNEVYEAALGYKLEAPIAPESDIFVITGKRTKLYNDESAVVITVLQDGDEVDYTLYNETGKFESAKVAPADLKKGDIILMAPAVEGVVDDYEVLYADGKIQEYDGKDVVIGAATTKKDASSATRIFFDKENAEKMGAIVTKDGDNYFMTMKAQANYILVDKTEDEANPEFSEEAPSTSLVETDDYFTSVVFARVIDEKLVDVVVYKTANK